MHLIVPYAATATLLERAMAEPMATPMLDQIVAGWVATRRDDADASTLSTAHEREWGGALGWVAPDGCLPWAALLAQADGIPIGDRAWGLLTPVHWRVASDGVHVADPALLDLGDAESRALFEAVRPLFESQGYATAWGAALRWYVAHESLQGLACASLDRVIGRNLDAWLPRQPEAKPLRRLQNEAQMTLHRHPVNETREAAGALTVNSFWLSGCGRAQAVRGADVQVDDRLRAPALRDDAAAWCTAWRALDRDALAPLLSRGARGEPVRLTLCSEHAAVALAPRTGGWWQRVARRLAAPRASARSLLASL